MKTMLMFLSISASIPAAPLVQGQVLHGVRKAAIPNVTVSLYALSGGSNGRQLYSRLSTDNQGRYSLVPPNNGMYELEFLAPEFEKHHIYFGYTGSMVPMPLVEMHPVASSSLLSLVEKGAYLKVFKKGFAPFLSADNLTIPSVSAENLAAESASLIFFSIFWGRYPNNQSIRGHKQLYLPSSAQQETLIFWKGTQFSIYLFPIEGYHTNILLLDP